MEAEITIRLDFEPGSGIGWCNSDAVSWFDGDVSPWLIPKSHHKKILQHDSFYLESRSAFPAWHLWIWPLLAVPHSGISHVRPNLVVLLNCLSFPKVTTFTCSFGALDVNVSVFNMSFSGAGVRGLALVRAVEGADRYNWSIPSRAPAIFSACHSVSDSVPNQWTYRITVADLWMHDGKPQCKKQKPNVT